MDLMISWAKEKLMNKPIADVIRMLKGGLRKTTKREELDGQRSSLRLGGDNGIVEGEYQVQVHQNDNLILHITRGSRKTTETRTGVELGTNNITAFNQRVTRSVYRRLHQSQIDQTKAQKQGQTKPSTSLITDSPSTTATGSPTTATDSSTTTIRRNRKRKHMDSSSSSTAHQIDPAHQQKRRRPANSGGLAVGKANDFGVTIIPSVKPRSRRSSGAAPRTANTFAESAPPQGQHAYWFQPPPLMRSMSMSAGRGGAPHHGCTQCGHPCLSISLTQQQQQQHQQQHHLNMHHHVPFQPFTQSYPNMPAAPNCTCLCGHHGVSVASYSANNYGPTGGPNVHYGYTQAPPAQPGPVFNTVNPTQLPLAVTQPNNKYSPYRVPSPDDDDVSNGNNKVQFATKSAQLDKIINAQFRLAPPSQPHLLKLRHSMPPLPPTAWADVHIVWNLMCWKDLVYQRQRDPYWRVRHPTIQRNMRHILLDWMAEVCEVYSLHRETYHVAVDLFDRFMSTCSSPVGREKLQLIGTAALFVAAKLEEIYPPKIEEFALVTDSACSPKEIKATELLILATVKWSLCPMTAVHWLAMYLQVIAANVNDSLRHSNHGYHSAETTLMHQSTSTFTGCELDTTSSTSYMDTTMDSNSSTSMSRQSAHARRALFNQVSCAGSVGDGLTRPDFDKTAFMSVCQLLDFCLLDEGWLRFPYGVLAASALFLQAADCSMALQSSGFRTSDLDDCLQWMRPFAVVVSELEIPCTPHARGFAPADAHNVQTHSVDCALLENALPTARIRLNYENLSHMMRARGTGIAGGVSDFRSQPDQC